MKIPFPAQARPAIGRAELEAFERLVREYEQADASEVTECRPPAVIARDVDAAREACLKASLPDEAASYWKQRAMTAENETAWWRTTFCTRLAPDGFQFVVGDTLLGRKLRLVEVPLHPPSCVECGAYLSAPPNACDECAIRALPQVEPVR